MWTVFPGTERAVQEKCLHRQTTHSVLLEWLTTPRSGVGARCLTGDVRSSVVGVSQLKSKDPGFDPLVEQGEEQFFYSSESTLVQNC